MKKIKELLWKYDQHLQSNGWKDALLEKHEDGEITFTSTSVWIALWVIALAFLTPFMFRFVRGDNGPLLSLMFNLGSEMMGAFITFGLIAVVYERNREKREKAWEKQREEKLENDLHRIEVLIGFLAESVAGEDAKEKLDEIVDTWRRYEARNAVAAASSEPQ